MIPRERQHSGGNRFKDLGDRHGAARSIAGGRRPSADAIHVAARILDADDVGVLRELARSTRWESGTGRTWECCRASPGAASGPRRCGSSGARPRWTFDQHSSSEGGPEQRRTGARGGSSASSTVALDAFAAHARDEDFFRRRGFERTRATHRAFRRRSARQLRRLSRERPSPPAGCASSGPCWPQSCESRCASSG